MNNIQKAFMNLGSSRIGRAPKQNPPPRHFANSRDINEDRGTRQMKTTRRQPTLTGRHA